MEDDSCVNPPETACPTPGDPVGTCSGETDKTTDSITTDKYIEPSVISDDIRSVCPELKKVYDLGNAIRLGCDTYTGDEAFNKYAFVLAYNRLTKKNKINPSTFIKRCYYKTTKPVRKGETEQVLTWGFTEQENKAAMAKAEEIVNGLFALQTAWRNRRIAIEKEKVVSSRPTNKVTIDTDIRFYSLTQHTDMCIDAISKVYNKDNKRIFIRNGSLSNVVYDEKGSVKIATLDRDGIRNVLDKCCNFITFKENEKGLLKEENARPPRDVCENILATTGLFTRLPVLAGLTEAPYITPNGKVITEPGYNEDTGLYFAPSLDYKKIVVPDDPTPEQIQDAINHLDELFVDFKFEDDAGRDNAIAAIFTAVLRSTINGCTPMYVVDKPQMGTGGSLICEIITILATGRRLDPSNAPKSNDTEEWEKIIVSILSSGVPSVCFDNIESNFHNAALASVLTARYKTCRVLGSTNHTTFSANVNWMGNGINLNIGGDIPRRIYLSRIVTDLARPQQRTGFTIPNIKEHVLSHRYEYLTDVLTIAKAYHNAGSPEPQWSDPDSLKTVTIPEMGSFEEWRRYIGGIMIFMGKYNFLANTESVLSACEDQNSEGEALLEKIYEIYTDKEFSAKMIIEDVSKDSNLPQYRFDEFLPGYISSEEGHSKTKKLGKFFLKIKGRVFSSGYKIIQSSMKHKIAQWKVMYIPQQAQCKL